MTSCRSTSDCRAIWRRRRGHGRNEMIKSQSSRWTKFFKVAHYGLSLIVIHIYIYIVEMSIYIQINTYIYMEGERERERIT